MPNTINIRGNGKLLLTGEYLVLAGARALALPLRFGQQLTAGYGSSTFIDWQSYQQGNLWFSAAVNPETLMVVSESHPEVAARLSQVLQAARILNPGFLLSGEYNFSSFRTDADYPLEWGLGSSSTLIYLIASLAGVDPFILFRKCSNGSGYDVACAAQSAPFFYTLTKDYYTIDPAMPGQALRKYAFFGYSGKKTDSFSEVQQFHQERRPTPSEIDQVSRLSEAICDAEQYRELYNLVNEHEQMIGKILDREPVIGQFPGFPGTIKSLGAWGGDFLMFVSDLSLPELSRVLTNYNIRDVFTFDQLKATH